MSRLSEVIMKEYPVSVTGLLNNYQLLFSQTIKPEEFDCSDMDSFVIKMSTEHNLWKVFYKGNNLWVKPSRATAMMMTEMQREGPGAPDVPEDAVFQDGFPPLNLPGLKEERIYPVVVTEVMNLQRIWFNIYHSDYYIALQSLMTDLDRFYNSEAGDRYKVVDTSRLKVGSVLAARFKKQQYHRVVLRSVLPHKKMLRLEYVDYGSVDYQSVKNCRYLTPNFTELPAQAIEGRLWRVRPLGGTDQQRVLNAKLSELLLYDCEPGSLLVEIQSGINLHEYDCQSNDIPVNLQSKRTMAFDLFDAFRNGGVNIGQYLIELGLAKEEVGEEVILEGQHRFIKYIADRAEKLRIPSRWREVTRKETDQSVSSSVLQLLRLYEAGVASTLDQLKAEAAAEKKNRATASLKDLEAKIKRYQTRLDAIIQRREDKEVEEGIEK